MADGRKNNGGHKTAGRKTKADEENAKKLIKRALKEIYRKDNDEEATIEFIKEFSTTSRGQLFIAEHVLGKPRDVVMLDNNVTTNIDLSKLDMETLIKLKKVEDNEGAG